MGALTASEVDTSDPGTVAAHWCMYWRDSGEHEFHTGFKGKPRCVGCGKDKK